VDEKPQQPALKRAKYVSRIEQGKEDESLIIKKAEVEKQLAKFIIDMCDDMDLDPGEIALAIINEYDMNPEDLFDSQWLQEYVRDWG
jgi:hypothetical protein